MGERVAEVLCVESNCFFEVGDGDTDVIEGEGVWHAGRLVVMEWRCQCDDLKMKTPARLL